MEKKVTSDSDYDELEYEDQDVSPQKKADYKKMTTA